MVQTGVTFGSAATTTGLGNVWQNIEFILSPDDGSSAFSQAINTSANSRFIDVTDFNFSIPSTHFVDGIELKINKREFDDDDYTGTTDNTIQLLYNNDVIGENKAKSDVWSVGIESGDGFENIAYGSATDTWGYFLTPTIVNNSTFGVRIKINMPTITFKEVAGSIDHLDLQIWYTEAGILQSAEQDHESSTITLTNQVHEVEVLSAEAGHESQTQSAGGNLFILNAEAGHEATNPVEVFAFTPENAPESRTLVVKPE